MDPERVRALSNFYREEFQRHIQHLEANGIATNRVTAARVSGFMRDLDHVCCQEDFQAVAETLLESFEVLTRLSQVDPRRGH